MKTRDRHTAKNTTHLELGLASGVDLIAMRGASGFAHIALRDAGVEALLVDEATRTEFLAAARLVRKVFKALLPDPAAAKHQTTVAAIRGLADRIADVSRPPKVDLAEVTDAVDALLDRSVGAEEYIIRAAAEGSEPDALVDLSQIDFESLAATFAGRKRAETDRLAAMLKQRAFGAAGRNPTRYDLVERIEQLIDEYNAGSLNIDEYLRRLIELSKHLSVEEQRAAGEGLTEAELAIFDLLTKPDPVLTDEERSVVKDSAKRLLEQLRDKLVLDWRRRSATAADVRTTIRDVLDADLPADPYPPDVFDEKVQSVFDHVAQVYGDDGTSVYDKVEEVASDVGISTLTPGAISVEAFTDEVVERLRHDADFVALVPERLGLTGKPELRTVDELIENDEDYDVEFKSTARWDLRENARSKNMEDAVVKTVAGFLNADGGTLLIGSGPDGAVVGLEYDYACVKPANGDGFVNWVTTHLITALGHAPVSRTRARIVRHAEKEICRIDVASSPIPVHAKTSKLPKVFFVRMNNTTRALPENEIAEYLAVHWGGLAS